MRLAFAMEFVDSFDLTAVGTLALAVVTLWLVIVTRRALRQAQEGIEQTQREIELSRQEVEEAHRPVLIPVVDDTRRIVVWGGGEQRARPFYLETARVVVPITNIGSGPALNVEMALTPRNDAGGFSEARGNRRFTKTIVGIGVRHMTSAAVYIEGLAPGDAPNFDLRLRYSDVAGKRWETSAKYLRAEGGKYTSLSIRQARDVTSEEDASATQAG